MSESRIAWGGVSRGLGFIVFGSFLLLWTLDLLPPGFWLDALAFWPVILIIAGVRIMFVRSRMPWAVLLSPLILMGTLTYVAWRGPEPPSADWRRVEAARAPDLETWSLEPNLAMATLDVRAGPPEGGLLLQGRTTRATDDSVRVSDRGASARVTLPARRTWRQDGLFLVGSRQDWEVEVTNDLPMALHLTSAFAEADMDLESVTVTDVSLGGAFNDLTLRLGAPAADTRLHLGGAFNRLVLIVPDNTPVWISTDGPNSVSERQGPRQPSGPAYRLRTEGALNRIIVRSE